MKTRTILLCVLLSVLLGGFQAFGQPVPREATAAEVNAGTQGAPAFITPRRLNGYPFVATNLPLSTATNIVTSVGIASQSGKGTNTAFAGTIYTTNGAANLFYSNSVVKLLEVQNSTNCPFLLDCTNIYLNGTDGTIRHITITAFSSIVTSSDGAFGGVRKGTQIETFDNNGQYEIENVLDANHVVIVGLWQGFFTQPQSSIGPTTNWGLLPPTMQQSDNVIGGGTGNLFHQYNWVDDGGQPTYGGVNDNGTITFSDNDNTSTVLTLGMVPLNYIHSGGFRSLPGELFLGLGSCTTNAHFNGGIQTANAFWVSSMAELSTMGLFSDNSDNRFIHVGGTLTNILGSTIPVASALVADNNANDLMGNFHGLLSNTVIKIRETQNTTNCPFLVDNTNIYLNGTDGTFRHIAITAFNSIATSSDGAFGGVRKGTQLETFDNNGQYEIFNVIDANHAVIHGVLQGYWTQPQGSVSTTTNWAFLPPTFQASDNTVGGGVNNLAHQMTWVDNNGMPTYAGINDNGLLTIADSDGTGTLVSMGMVPVNSIHSGGFRTLPGEVFYGFGSSTTNTHFNGSIQTANAFWISSMAELSTLGLFSDNSDNRMIHLGGTLTNILGNTIPVASILQATAGIGSLQTNALLAVTTGGVTNTTAYNYRIMGFTGTSVVQTNRTSTLGFSRGTITTPTDIILQSNEFLFGSSCAAQGTQAL